MMEAKASQFTATSPSSHHVDHRRAGHGVACSRCLDLCCRPTDGSSETDVWQPCSFVTHQCIDSLRLLMTDPWSVCAHVVLHDIRCRGGDGHKLQLLAMGKVIGTESPCANITCEVADASQLIGKFTVIRAPHQSVDVRVHAYSM